MPIEMAPPCGRSIPILAREEVISSARCMAGAFGHTRGRRMLSGGGLEGRASCDGGVVVLEMASTREGELVKHCRCRGLLSERIVVCESTDDRCKGDVRRSAQGSRAEKKCTQASERDLARRGRALVKKAASDVRREGGWVPEAGRGRLTGLSDRLKVVESIGGAHRRRAGTARCTDVRPPERGRAHRRAGGWTDRPDAGRWGAYIAAEPSFRLVLRDAGRATSSRAGGSVVREARVDETLCGRIGKTV